MSERKPPEGTLLDCRCGGKPEMDWSGAMEYYGHAWQSVDVQCNGECGRSVSVSVDGDNRAETRLAEALVAEMWNRLQFSIKEVAGVKDIIGTKIVMPYNATVTQIGWYTFDPALSLNGGVEYIFESYGDGVRVSTVDGEVVYPKEVAE